MTTFVDMYHPALGNVHISVPDIPAALSLYEAHGWVLSTGGGPDPTPIDLTVGLGDLRYAKLGDIPTPGTATGDALRAAYVAQADATKRARALRTWWGALGNAANAPANIFTVSDSILEGYNMANGGTYKHTNRPTAQLLTCIRSKWQPTGITGGLGYIPVAINSTPQTTITDWPFSGLSGGYYNNVGIGLRSAVFNPGDPSITLTVSNCTSVDLATRKSNGTVPGVLTVTLDGTQVATISTPTGPTPNEDLTFTRVNLPNLGSHTIVIAESSGYSFFHGAVLYNGDETAGVRMYEGGHGGFSTADFTAGDALTYLSQHAGVIQPALVIIELGTNVGGGTFSTQLQQIIAAIRSGCTTPPSFVLLGAWTATGANPDQQAIAAADDDVVFWDARTAIMPSNTTNPFDAGALLVDGLHPSAQGAAVIAGTLANFVMP